MMLLVSIILATVFAFGALFLGAPLLLIAAGVSLIFESLWWALAFVIVHLIIHPRIERGLKH